MASPKKLADAWAGAVAGDPQRAVLLDLGDLELRAEIVADVPRDDVAHGAAGAWVGVHGRRSDVTDDIGHGLVEVVVGRGYMAASLLIDVGPRSRSGAPNNPVDPTDRVWADRVCSMTWLAGAT